MSVSDAEVSISLPPFPNEIWYKVVGQVDEPIDLLRLSLSCKTMHDIATDELDYRSVLINYQNMEVFEGLSRNKIKSGAVQSLGITYESLATLGTERIGNPFEGMKHMVVEPLSFDESVRPNDDEPLIMNETIKSNSSISLSEWYSPITRALCKMVHLKSLILFIKGSHLKELSSAFYHLTAEVTHLRVCLLNDHAPSEEEIPEYVQTIRAIKGGLREFHWTTAFEPIRDLAILSEIVSLAEERCPDLEELGLEFLIDEEQPTIPCDALWESYWWQLRVFKVQGVDVGHTSRFVPFLDAHGTLEFLSVHGTLLDTLEAVRDTSLRRLNSLSTDDCTFNFLNSIFKRLPDTSFRPVKHLELKVAFETLPCEMRLWAAISEANQLTSLSIVDGPNLDGFSQARLWVFQVVASSLTNLDTLNLRVHISQNQLPAWLNVLERFKNLRTLRGRSHGSQGFLDAFSESPKPLELLAELEQRCPTLREVDNYKRVWVDGSRQ